MSLISSQGFPLYIMRVFLIFFLVERNYYILLFEINSVNNESYNVLKLLQMYLSLMLRVKGNQLALIRVNPVA